MALHRQDWTTDGQGPWSPEVDQFHRYWLSIRPGPDRLPAREDLKPTAIPRLLSSIWMLDVLPDRRSFRYRLVGTSVVAALGGEYTGKTLESVGHGTDPDDDGSNTLRGIIRDRQPRWRRGEPIWQHEKRVSMLETAIYPFATDGSMVDLLVGMTLFFDNEYRRLFR